MRKAKISAGAVLALMCLAGSARADAEKGWILTPNGQGQVVCGPTSKTLASLLKKPNIKAVGTAGSGRLLTMTFSGQDINIVYFKHYADCESTLALLYSYHPGGL